jgi:hypothetical protein
MVRIHERDDGAAADGAEQSASDEGGGVGVAWTCVSGV